mmetsp:Transcript_1783/g.1940  ORF Transcript_1783/g.1940 Transcript_1783/m.1940 type:complete len:92 (-) Transcript_1783:121-396(-)
MYHTRCDSFDRIPPSVTTHQSLFIDSHPAATTTTTNHRDRQMYRDLRVLLPDYRTAAASVLVSLAAAAAAAGTALVIIIINRVVDRQQAVV